MDGHKEIKSQYVCEQVAHEITTLSLAKLRKDRAVGKGIPYVKIGRSVRYFLPDIYQYMNSRRIVTK